MLHNIKLNKKILYPKKKNLYFHRLTCLAFLPPSPVIYEARVYCPKISSRGPVRWCPCGFVRGESETKAEIEKQGQRKVTRIRDTADKLSRRGKKICPGEGKYKCWARGLRNLSFSFGEVFEMYDWKILNTYLCVFLFSCVVFRILSSLLRDKEVFFSVKNNVFVQSILLSWKQWQFCF